MYKSLRHELLQERRGEAPVGRLGQGLGARPRKVLCGVEKAGLDDGEPPAVREGKGGVGLDVFLPDRAVGVVEYWIEVEAEALVLEPSPPLAEPSCEMCS